MAHRRSHEVEAAQMTVGTEERIDLVKPRPARDAAQQRPGKDGASAAEPVRETLLQALFELKHCKRSVAQALACNLRICRDSPMAAS
ncbi:hypothetical protein [Thermomonas hydrothermalis]|uniref:hypothetical protein n=1 Tax=Thermomonas hydrothermalis TaxID=213588 RepID=UPI002354DDBE|nr:hypothetical protein [Thermomonas hydrothermalis]